MADFILDRDVLVQAFSDLGQRAWVMGKTVEIAVYGGSALMLSYDWRLATKDVDDVSEADRITVRALAAEIAAERGWPSDWLNDGVEGFLSAIDRRDGVKQLHGEFPSSGTPGLRVFVARPEYLFAMKCCAMRVGGVDANGDVDDIRRLAGEIGLHDVKDAYLAATAEHLAGVYHLEAPAWAEHHGRSLRRAFFAGGLESIKAALTVESPAAFRRRLLFISKDALSRPSRNGDVPVVGEARNRGFWACWPAAT